MQNTEESMSSFFRFTLLVALALFSFCIKLAPAAQFPPPFSLPPCNMSPNSRWISEKAIDANTKNLTLFKLSFLTNQSLSFTFTTTYSDIEDGAPGLVFIILVIEPGFFPCMREQYTFSHEPLSLHVCNPHPLPHEQIQAPTSCLLGPADPYHSDDTPFKDVVSLTYNATATSLHLQANFSGGSKTNETFSKNDLQPDGVHDSTVRNEILTLFVGFITSGDASINVSNSTNVTTGVCTMNSAPPPIGEASCTNVINSNNVSTGVSTMNSAPPPISGSLPHVGVDDNAKSNHKKAVVWVIVGVSMMGLLMGLLILVLFITKRRRRPSLLSSRPAGLGAPPSVASRAPFSHHDFESSATPMMKALPLSPPHTSAFQISGTASWLQQPNPR